MDTEFTRQSILEALLFVAEEPLSLTRLQEVLGDAEASATETAVRDLALALDREGRGLMVQEVAGGFRLTTRPEADPWVQKLVEIKPARLSRPALETLAIIAYRQPITRAEIEQVRGVAVDGVLRTLLERDLIRMLGRKAEAGRPIVYGTSATFLEHFGFKDLGELPSLKEIDELLGPSGAALGTPGTRVLGPAAIDAQAEHPLLPLDSDAESDAVEPDPGPESDPAAEAGTDATAGPAALDAQAEHPLLTPASGPAPDAAGGDPDPGGDPAAGSRTSATAGPASAPAPGGAADRDVGETGADGSSAAPETGDPHGESPGPADDGAEPGSPCPTESLAAAGGLAALAAPSEPRDADPEPGPEAGGAEPRASSVESSNPEERPEARGERLQKVLARAGVASRRHSETLIAEGRVRVNGEVVRTPGTRVTPADRVVIDGRAVRAEAPVTLILHKPAGYITSRADPQGRPVVMALLPREGLPRLFPVGRLDWDSEGLLLLTNDGELANLLTHPRQGVSKTYHAKLKGHPNAETLGRLLRGVMSQGERLWATEVQMLSRTKQNAWVAIRIEQGRYRQIRRMCEALGHPVQKLVRVALGPLTLGALPRGQWRHLLPEERRLLEALRAQARPERP